MTKMPIISLPETAKALGDSGGRVNVLWQQPDSLVFMARGREYRSEFHINPSDEVMYPIKGDLKLHYRNEEGKEEIAEVPEGSVIYTPAGTPHSPRFAPDAYLLVMERKQTEVTALFTAVAASLTLLAASLSLMWFNRIL